LAAFITRARGDGLLVWETFIEASAVIFHDGNSLFLLAGVLIGFIFGAIPGISGIIALSLLLPMTFGMDSARALVFLISAYGACTFGGAVTAILLNIPGTAHNVTTCFDGYPLARQGRAGYAIGAAMTASSLGGVVGLIILGLMIPVARQAILAFSYPEFFLLAIVGISVITVTSQANLFKGLIAGGLGILLSLYGHSPITGEMRFTFGSLYLLDGISLMPVLTGIFAVTEVIRLSLEEGAIAQTRVAGGTKKDALLGVLAVFKHFKVFIVSSFIGTIVGMVPGIGGTTASFVAYGQAAQFSRNRDNFGKGAIEGVIASEAANDSKEGGALLPTVVFGIPGSAAMAVLMVALLFHNITPGRAMLNENLLETFILLAGNLYGHILAGIIAIAFVSQLTAITYIRTKLICPVITVFTLVGIYSLKYSVWDVMLTIIFGIIGYIMYKLDFPRIPLVIALVLGNMVEMTYYQTMIRFGISGFFTRPISLFLILVLIATLLLPFLQQKNRLKQVKEV
jgi:putative tricarboxylic transport membrane protein